MNHFVRSCFDVKILFKDSCAKALQFDSEKTSLFLWRWIQDRKNVKFGRSFSVKLHDLNRCGFFECQSQESCLFFVVAGKDLTRLDCYYLKLRSLKSLLKCGFLRKSFIMNAPLCTSLHPPKSDDWKWASDRRCIYHRWLFKKSTF